MDTTRQNKLSRQLHKDLTDIFQKDIKSFFGNSFVTVTHVVVSRDLGLAKIYFSVLPFKNGSVALSTLNNKKREIRGRLGTQIGKRIRKIPELAFFIDETNEKAQQMDDLIDRLTIPPKEKP